MFEIKEKSVIPIYSAGIAFLLYSLIFPLYRITDYIISVCVCALVFVITNKLTTKRTVLSHNIEKTNTVADKVIESGMKTIAEIKEMSNKLKDGQLKSYVDEIIGLAIEIFEYISAHPAQIRQTNTFLEYYLPITKKLVVTYLEFEEQNLISDAFENTMDKTKNALVMVKSAYKNQLEGLYSDKSLDILTDIAVLEQTLKMEGLE